MNLYEKWEKATKETRILRFRLPNLLSFEATTLPYMSLAESSINTGDTVVRKGEVVVQKPLIILPSNLPQFEGFEFEDDYQLNSDEIRRFLLMRGVSFPSLKYRNETYNVDVYEGCLKKAIEYFSLQMEKREDVHSGLIAGPEDCWKLSILIYVIALTSRSAPEDVRKILDNLRKKYK
ncbi:MAG: hypothetical protein U9O41_09465 [Candidatus Aerophobetes bacterium]|nr:hypothetical protein [Candidatus Aerophobetes bacterium]